MPAGSPAIDDPPGFRHSTLEVLCDAGDLVVGGGIMHTVLGATAPFMTKPLLRTERVRAGSGTSRESWARVHRSPSTPAAPTLPPDLGVQTPCFLGAASGFSDSGIPNRAPVLQYPCATMLRCIAVGALDLCRRVGVSLWANRTYSTN